MSPRKALIQLLLLLTVFVLAAGLLYSRYRDDELSVYVALVQSLEPLPEMKEVAFMGVASTCKISGSAMPDERELIASLVASNNSNAMPRPLEKLRGLANVAAWNDARRIHDAGGYDPLEHLTKKRIVRLSRVGFNEQRTRAVLCMETDGSGSLYFFERKSWTGPWREFSFTSVWVS